MKDNETWLDQEVNLFKKKDMKLSKKRKNTNKNTKIVNKFDEFISAVIKKLKKGKNKAAKIFKLTCNNNYESFPDILKKIETHNNNDCKQNFIPLKH